MPSHNFCSAREALAERLSLFLDREEAKSESWRWFDEGLGWGRARLFAHGEEPMPNDIQAKLATWFERRKRGEPWAYILGWSLWKGRRFIVTPATLIPRPETEQVLEEAFRLSHIISAEKLVDVGTGTGILAITIALESGLSVSATDISNDALEIARQNALMHAVNIDWSVGDLLEPIAGAIDMVVSNPPYIDPGNEKTLQRELGFEPRVALFSTGKGMDVATRLLGQCLERGVRGAVLEIGAGQGGELESRAFDMGWATVAIKQDMAKHDRVLIARL